MKLERTLIISFILLFNNNIYAMSADVLVCNQAIEKGDFEAALAQANKLLAQTKSDTQNNNDALICQGRAYSAKGDTDAAVVSLNSAADSAKAFFDKTIATILAGNAYKAAKRYVEALKSYQKALAYAQTDKNQKFERISQNFIGDMYFSTKQYQDALNAYVVASKLSANDNERGESYENIALTHHNIGQHDLALEYQIKAYFMHERVGTPDQYAHSSIELGRYYSIAKNYVSAERTLNKIIKFAKEQGGTYYEAQGSYLLAQVKFATGNAEEAKKLAEHAKKLALSTNDESLKSEVDQETKAFF